LNNETKKVTMELNKYCPVNEAIQFSSPLISCSQFQEQCRQILPEKFSSKKICNNDSMSKETAKKDTSPRKIKSPRKSLCHVDQSESTAAMMLIEKEKEECARSLDTDTQTIEELEEVCSIDHLKCDFDSRFDYMKYQVTKEFPEKDAPMETVKLTKMNKTKLEHLYYVSYFADSVDEKAKKGEKKIADGEVILVASVLYSSKKKVMQEYLLLPEQTLSDFRDVIGCPSDEVTLGEQSNNQKLVDTQVAKDVYGSSYFFIEGCFYNDTRNPLNRDYSKLLIEWAKSPERYTVPGLGYLKSTKMEEQSFGNLEVRLGYPYLYCHQGDCEHIIVFKDIRLANNEHPKYVSSYPYRYYEAYRRRRRCSVCNIHLVKWITVNDELAFEHPSFFCEKCFNYLHYDNDGEKLCSFEAYPYTEID